MTQEPLRLFVNIWAVSRAILLNISSPMKTRKNVGRGLSPACGNGEMGTRGRETRPLQNVNNLGIDLIIALNFVQINRRVAQKLVQ